MTEKVFEYGGYHFVPERELTEEERGLTSIVSHQRLDTQLGFCKKNYTYPSKFDYSHNGFYNAATDKKCDLFRCEENGKLYIPCENDLQEYFEGNNYRKEVEDSVDAEFNAFKNNMLHLSKEAIFDTSFQINFYNELHDFLNAEQTEIDDEDFECLYEDRGHILSLLYDYYCENEYACISSLEEIGNMVHSYNENYFEKILDGEAELE